jgi:hypothetical protein
MNKSRVKTQIKIWTISILIAFLLLVSGYQYGKAGDCRPGEIDGQCGLSTACGIIYGTLGSLLVILSAAVYSLYLNRCDSKRTELSKDGTTPSHLND